MLHTFYFGAMKRIITLLLLFYSFTIHAQKIEQFYDYAWKPTEDAGRARYYTLIEKKDTLWLRQDYFIQEKKLQMIGTYRDKETNIPVGSFSYYHANGRLQSQGSYKNGKKEGLWLRYYDNGMMQDSTTYENGNITGTALGWHRNGFVSDSSVYREDGSGISVSWFDNGNPSSAGAYSAGRKATGKWQYFHKNGNPSANEVYANGQLRSRQYYDESGTAIQDTAARESEAIFPGGMEAWKKYLGKHIYFPSQYKINGADQVVVTVDWVVDEEGNVTDVFVSSPFHPEFDRIAFDAISRSPKWKPAISHNRRIKAYRRQPLTFAQE